MIDVGGIINKLTSPDCTHMQHKDGREWTGPAGLGRGVGYIGRLALLALKEKHCYNFAVEH